MNRQEQTFRRIIDSLVSFVAYGIRGMWSKIHMIASERFLTKSFQEFMIMMPLLFQAVIGKVNYFYQAVPKYGAFMFQRHRARCITNIDHSHNAIIKHFLFSSLHALHNPAWIC